MNKFVNGLYHYLYEILKIIILIMSVLLFISALFFTAYINDMNTQTMLLKTDNIIFSILGIGIFLLISSLTVYCLRKHTAKGKQILLFIVLFWYLFAGCILVLFSRSAPAADPRSVYEIAAVLATGNTGVIHPTDSYLSYYPHQVGLVAYYEVILRIWNLLPIGLPGYHALKLLNVLWACGIIYFQYKTLDILFKNDKVQIIYLLLMLCNLPLLIYTSFVYGEIPSFACFSIGLWSLLKVLEAPVKDNMGHFKKLWFLYTLLSCIAFILCIMLRKNALILLLAVMGATLLETLRHKKWFLLINLTAYLCISCFTLTLVQAHYEHRADNYLSSGVTPLSYFAMGMQESSRGEGWYNGFNFNTYQNSGLNTETANQISKKSIEERMNYFKEQPAEMLRFYVNKYRLQWCDGTYASLQATQNDGGGRRTVFQRLYNGSFDFIFIPLCNLMQTLLYLGTLFFALEQRKFKHTESMVLQGFPLYICIIGTLGGLIFHMLWEANSRYIFPYALLLYPYAAYGFARLTDILPDKLKRSK